MKLEVENQATAPAVLPPQEAKVLEMLKDAALLRLAAAVFAYPDEEHRAAVAFAFDEALRVQRDRISRSPWSAEFARAQKAWGERAELLENDYVRLFLGAAPCPLHESAWGDGRRMGGRVVELADVAGFYRAFGFELSNRTRDLPDHLSAELEFVAALLIKQAYALADGLDEPYAITKEAVASFLSEHLGRWPDALRSAVVNTDAGGAYPALADLVVALVAAQCERYGVTPRLADGRVSEDDDACLVCPMAGREQTEH